MKSQRIQLLIALLLLNIAAFVGWFFIRNHFEFAFTPAFWLLLLLPLLCFHHFFFSEDSKGKLIFPLLTVSGFKKSNFYSYLPFILFATRIAALWFLIMALARPQSKDDFESTDIEGIDIMLSLDVSESMLAKDFNPNRLESAKEVAIEFVDGRPDDRIGLVVFQAEAFTQVPLTTDHRVVKNALAEIQPGLLTSGTAIGMGLATAVNRLKQGDALSKTIILLTDGMDNSGAIRPMDAAAMAKTFNIHVYTIGVGTKGKAKQPVAIDQRGNYIFDWVDVEIDEEVLSNIANLTGGKYFRATSEQKLREIYSEINELEKTKFQVTQYSRRTEEFWKLLLPALVILFSEFILRYIFFRTTT